MEPWRILDVDAAALAAGVTPRTIRNWIKAGLPDRGRPRRPRIDPQDLLRWVNQRPRPGRPRHDTPRQTPGA